MFHLKVLNFLVNIQVGEDNNTRSKIYLFEFYMSFMMI